MALRPLSPPEVSRPLASPLAVVGRGLTPAPPSVAGRIDVRAAGFTLLETMMVLALVMVVSGIAIPVSRNMIARSKAQSATMEMLTWFEAARNRATAERRNFEVTINSTQRTITIQRVEYDGSKTDPPRVRQLPENVAFVQYSGVGDTPDQFGAASPIDFDGPAPYLFTTEGMFVDGNGDPSNGTLFIGKPGLPDTGAAMTVFGTTGLLRAWKLAGKQWRK
jgi:type II secretory pathway pseudopilin PulG